MLAIQSLTLFQFKNYNNRSFAFNGRVVGISGNNGVGKTNLLDAIHYLCFTKSYFTRLDANNVMQGENGFRLEGEFLLNGQIEKAVCIFRETGKKEFSVNDQPYDKFSQHIGHYPCVIIAPDDASMITGNSDERRKFIDALLSQIDSDYLNHLIVYTRVLQQRNSLLKSFAETGQRNLELLDVLDRQLIQPGNYIFNTRRDFLLPFLPAVKRLYQEIARQPEEFSLVYKSELLNASFEELFHSTRNRDFMLQRTTAGIHRDDIDIMFGAQPFRSIASQGQRKSLLFALRLAEMDVLKREKGFPPLLLLDDVFEKLDEDRIGNLLQMVCQDNEGQVFITDTNEARLKKFVRPTELIHL